MRWDGKPWGGRVGRLILGGVLGLALSCGPVWAETQGKPGSKPVAVQTKKPGKAEVKPTRPAPTKAAPAAPGKGKDAARATPKNIPRNKGKKGSVKKTSPREPPWRRRAAPQRSPPMV